VPLARQVSPRARLEQRAVHRLAALRPVHGVPPHQAHDARAVRLERSVQHLVQARMEVPRAARARLLEVLA